jgi:putative NADPH-quinone reductase
MTAATPFIHYVSPRLRAEAVNEVNIIHTNFSRLLSSLVKSRHREATEIGMELEETREELNQTKQVAEEQKRELERQREQLIQKEALILQFQQSQAT